MGSLEDVHRGLPGQVVPVAAAEAQQGVAAQLAAEGKVLIIAPDDTCGVKTLTRDQEALKKLYTKGLHDAEAIRDFVV